MVSRPWIWLALGPWAGLVFQHIWLRRYLRILRSIRVQQSFSGLLIVLSGKVPDEEPGEGQSGFTCGSSFSSVVSRRSCFRHYFSGYGGSCQLKAAEDNYALSRDGLLDVSQPS
ncbi:hypothetical protein F4778DRAFT_8845 [Xylariomycetidae sp. FL2044]|nr:hypothetical protein F4778DRAFT_8845 [Xylariomycetidae sp. FL2044]